MPNIPAFCDGCGAIFNSGIVAENASNITFSNVGCGPCPVCGGNGYIPDGVFNFIGNTIQVLSAPDRTVFELKKLAIILQESRTRKELPEETVKRIIDEVPALSSLAQLLPKNRTEWIAYAGLIIGVIQIIISLQQTPQSGQTIQNITVNQVIQNIYDTQKPVKSPVQKNKRIGPNERCTCGSGIKYKKCCGKSCR